MTNNKSQPIDPDSLSVVLATDCGSTTTKAILFEKKNDGWRQTYRGEAPTTVEKPVADVTIGALNAFAEVQELSGRKIICDSQSGELPPFQKKVNAADRNGIDLYLSTSSAGGGLQMIVAGVVSSMTTESAERAALGAGAIVMDAISIDDKREQHERVKKIRHLRPDIILIAGGIDGGTIDHPLELAETILQADPRPRFGETLRLPVIYAANTAAVDAARTILEKRFEFVAVQNIRPTLEQENLGPARDAIHELFLHHVMSHAPGYRKLLGWSPLPIIPTPAAFGYMVENAAKRWNIQVLAVDIGGATTDVFSVFRGPDQHPIFNRTVSANLGMSYSIANVMLESGLDNILRWLPFPNDERSIQDRLRNKMIRPTSIPQTMEDLLLEQAVCREALRLAFDHHKSLAVNLKGAQKQRSIGDIFRQSGTETLIDLLHLDMIIGSGGVLSHAPNRLSAAFMMLDAYQPLGVTQLTVDSIFMMPHLGVLSTIHPAAASEIFIRDCLIPLGMVIAPSGNISNIKHGTPLADMAMPKKGTVTLHAGELRRVELGPGEEIEVTIKPLLAHLDFGAGRGQERTAILRGGEAGILLDGRGRPLVLPVNQKERVSLVKAWYEELGLSLR